MASRIGRLYSALALSMLATPALAQDFNDLWLATDDEGATIVLSPSVGSAPGTFPIALATHQLYWRVFPASVLHHPLGTMEITGLTTPYYDTDWVASPDGVPGATNFTFDYGLFPGILSEAGGTGLNPGNIEPEFGSAAEIDIAGADVTGAFTNPCVTGSPAFIAAACDPTNPLCPNPGNVVGYILGFDFTNGDTQPGIVVPADGATHLAWVSVEPAGMSVAGGTCGLGDFIVQQVLSDNESQSPLLPGGGVISQYGGFSAPGFNITADAVNEVVAEPLEFREPVSEPLANVGAGLEAGLAGINLMSGGGLNQMGMRYYSGTALTGGPGATPELAFFFAATDPPFPPFARPGLPLFDMNILVNIFDPLAGTISAFWAGFVAPGGTFAPAAPDGIFTTVGISVFPVLVGFTLTVQGFNFDLVSDFDNSQLVRLPVLP